MRGILYKVCLPGLCVFLLAGCGGVSRIKDASPADGGSDLKKVDILVRDGPVVEGLKPDGPMDLSKPDALDISTQDSAPDAVACPASKSVWGTMVWGGGCLWQ